MINSIIKIILKYSQLITQSENLLAIGLVVVEIESETAIRLRRKEKSSVVSLQRRTPFKKMAELHTCTGNVSGQTILLMTDEFAVYTNLQN